MTVKVGQHVTYVDSQAHERPAIVTNVFGTNDTPSINVAYVNDDEAQSDSYGRKIERSTSVPHRSSQQAHGNYWVE